jgi:hypothetical protein
MRPFLARRASGRPPTSAGAWPQRCRPGPTPTSRARSRCWPAS